MNDMMTSKLGNALTDTVPLSFAQQRMWFLHQLKPNSPTYNVFHHIHFTQSISIYGLKKAIESLVERHEILRTGFVIINNQPYQLIKPSKQLIVREVNLQSNAQPLHELKNIATAEALKPFDLVNDQLMRITFVRINSDESFLLICMHHIITDAWSSAVFNRELKIFYEAVINGTSPVLPELKMQYRDYAAWQYNWLNESERKVQLAFWKKQLEGLQPFHLSLANTPSTSNLFRGLSKHFKVPAHVFVALKRISMGEEQTMFVTLLAAFKVLLYKYSGQTDIAVGCPVSGRNSTSWEALIGLFVNTVVLRSSLSANDSFIDVCRKIRQVAYDAFEHQELPFEMIVEALHPDRDIMKNPLFQIVFQFQTEDTEFASGNREGESTGIPSTTSKFDLTLSITQSSDDLTGFFEYNQDLFSAKIIDDVIRHFLQLLKKVSDHPQKLIATLSLTEMEDEKLLKNIGRGTSTNFPDNVFVHHLISEKANSDPDKIAVFSDKQSISYSELEAQSNRLANLIIKKNLKAEPVIVVYMNRSVEMIVTHLAILKAGGAFVPLDVSYPEERIAYMLEDLHPDLLFVDSALISRLPQKDYNVFVADKEWQLLNNYQDHVPAISLTQDHRAYIMFTSGSTGKPKGVELIHRGFTNLVRWNIRAYAINVNDRCLQMATPAYDAYIFELFPCLAAGATVYIVDDITRTSSGLLRKTLIEKKISITFMSTAIGQAVMEEPWPPDISLRILALGGEKLLRLPSAIPSFDFLNFYGPTENSVMTTNCQVRMDNKNKYPSIGRSIDNVQLYVMDAFLNLVPLGHQGELYLGGKGVGRGYYHRPGLTADKFIPDPFSEEPGSRLYKTGDLVRFLPDGNLEFIGRTDHQVKIRGFRIELKEIEKHLHAHHNIKEAVVVIRENENGNQLIAYVAGPDLSVTAIREYLKQKLPAFMIPSFIIPVNDLPKSINGKIDRNVLPEPNENIIPDEDSSQEVQTEMEKTVTEIWKQFLPVDRINVEANFFDMGGHSLMMARVHHRLKEVLHSEISLVTLFQFPTIRSLAKHLEEIPAPVSSPQITDRAYKQRQIFLQQRKDHKPV